MNAHRVQWSESSRANASKSFDFFALRKIHNYILCPNYYGLARFTNIALHKNFYLALLWTFSSPRINRRNKKKANLDLKKEKETGIKEKDVVQYSKTPMLQSSFSQFASWRKRQMFSRAAVNYLLSLGDSKGWTIQKVLVKQQSVHCLRTHKLKLDNIWYCQMWCF